MLTMVDRQRRIVYRILHSCSLWIYKNIPIFISESAGMEASGDGLINYEEWNKWIESAEKNQTSWVTWSIADKDETCSVPASRR